MLRVLRFSPAPLLLGACLALQSFFVPSSMGATSPAKPNILMISIDDLNDWVGFLSGHPLVQTPNLDRLAKRSAVFTKAYCAAPVCGPSRAAVFTGLAPTRTGMYSNANHLAKLNPKARYFHQDLAQHGYHTMGTGKLLHGNQGGPESFHEYGPGFNKWNPLTKQETQISASELEANGPIIWHTVKRADGFTVRLPLNEMPRDRNPHSDRIESFDWGVIDLPESEWSDTKCADWAIGKLAEPHSKPFFLGLGFYRPHQPLWAPKKYHDLYPPSEMPLPPHLAEDLNDVPVIGKMIGRLPLTSGSHATVTKHEQWQRAISAYLACISYVDAQLGRVLNALESSPHADNTVIIVWADHGWHLGEKEHWGKFTAWERAARVPLLIHLPETLKQNGYLESGIHNTPVSLLDLYPTVLDLAGLKRSQDLDGMSLAPLLRGEKPTFSRMVATSVGPGNHSLRNQRWRFIQYYDGSHELYDLEKDPFEHSNLADRPAQQSRIQRFQSHLPVDPKISHFLRIGEWKALVSATDQSIALFGPGVANIDGSKNVAKDHPKLIHQIEAYLKHNPETPRFSSIPN